MQRFRNRALVGFLVPILIASLAGCRTAKPQTWVEDYKYVDFDPFPGMNVQGRNVTLTQQDINGRVIWNLWSGDNAGFWNWLAMHGFGTGDLLKMIASPRNQRFQTYGVVNQPGFMKPAQPDEYGLYIDVPREPGSKYDIDKRLDIPTYGISSGIMGLRLFKNPNFDRSKWDVNKYWREPAYYQNPKLERPYRVGMACSFCHIGPDPTNPAADPNEPDFGNLSDYVGQHYMKVWEVFAHDMPADNFVKQLLMSNPAGTLDTSFIATDYLNNPGTMNAVYNFPGRVSVAQAETISGGATDLKNLEYVAGRKDMVMTPRVLKEGADSAGLHAALSRVYLNIGEYYEEWTQNFTWQHATPSTKLTGIDGLHAVLAQLDGFEVAASAWERAILPLRIERYETSLLDTLCLTGEIGWARLSASETSVVSATPIALFLREHAHVWQRAPIDASLSDDALAILETLRARGASFARDLGSHEALAELVSAGFISSDGFAGLRALIDSRQRADLAGRWSLLEQSDDIDVETQARVLLRRYGIVFRRLAAREPNAAPWRELARVYRRLEARGEIRGGRFVTGMSGEQFALPEAVEQLRETRRSHPDGTLIVISAADPLNLTGILTAGDRVRAVAANRIAYRDGVAVSVLEGDYLRPLHDDGSTAEVAASLAGRRVPVASGFVGRTA